jgi:hypothetical protein
VGYLDSAQSDGTILIGNHLTPLTVEGIQPTPILIRGVERRCAIATDCNPEAGRPYGLYGNNFSRAKPEAIQQAIQLIQPPTITNIIAMEAPPGGYGIYTKAEIAYIFATAFTGFSAARLESQLELDQYSGTVIHTGFWGCGAYGGNRVLMALLQLLAARISQVSRLVFHTGNTSGKQILIQSQQILDELLGSASLAIEIDHLIDRLYELDFQWGIGDGN